MIAPVVVVADESRDSRLQIVGQFVWYLVYVPLQRLVVASLTVSRVSLSLPASMKALVHE